MVGNRATNVCTTKIWLQKFQQNCCLVQESWIQSYYDKLIVNNQGRDIKEDDYQYSKLMIIKYEKRHRENTFAVSESESPLVGNCKQNLGVG